MMLLARRQGYVQLAEPQRFTHAWERDATLRLRAGDVTVLADYEAARPAARRHRRGSHRTGLPRLARRLPRRQGHPADGPHRRPGPRAVPPRPRRPDPLRPRRRRPRRSASPRASRPAPGTWSWPAATPAPSRPGRTAGTWPTATSCRSPASRRPRQPAAEVRRLTGRDPDTGQARWSAPFQVPAPLPGRPRHPRLRDHRSTPRRAAPSAPPTSWSTGSATGRACTSP